MKYEAFLDKIKEFEGFRAHAYKCPAGVWTIGYGRVNVKPGDVTNKEREENWFRNYVATIEKEVRDKCVDFGYDFDDDKIYALTSFTYNCGLGNLCKLCDSGKRDVDTISNKILDKAKGNTLAGLTRRRQWEKDLFDGKFSTTSSKNPTAKELQTLINEVSNAGLVVDGKIGKKSIKAIYDYIMEVSN